MKIDGIFIAIIIPINVFKICVMIVIIKFCVPGEKFPAIKEKIIARSIEIVFEHYFDR